MAAVLVFIAGYVLHTLLPHHRSDFAPLPDEDRVREAVRELPQGTYLFPYAATMEDLKDPECRQKFKQGPVGTLTIWPTGVGPSGRQLGLQFVYVLAVTLLAGYVAGISLPAGTDYLKVFQVVGTTAWLGHAGALPLHSIWYHTPWSNTVKSMLDGLVYALLTAGVFGWLWPAL
ncbi:MAG: hypothetical protein KatS3mg042_1509 [Rhodothermaceae bacterium]|nr:MAG: hypothetical protein KatS3mg042_1509 [Rhodothermaceae bacterium]